MRIEEAIVNVLLLPGIASALNTVRADTTRLSLLTLLDLSTNLIWRSVLVPWSTRHCHSVWIYRSVWGWSVLDWFEFYLNGRTQLVRYCLQLNASKTELLWCLSSWCQQHLQKLVAVDEVIIVAPVSRVCDQVLMCTVVLFLFYALLRALEELGLYVALILSLIW